MTLYASTSVSYQLSALRPTNNLWVTVDLPVGPNEDSIRTGFNNLGDTGTSLSVNSGTGLKLNLQGGDDILYSVGNGADEIYAGSGNDTVYGGGGKDYVEGGSGNDNLYGEGGYDILVGGAGVDRLFGGDSYDDLYGDAGSDTLQGDAGNDYLDGGADQDTLIGGADADWLIGGAGADRLTGGSGQDTFIFRTGDLGRGHTDVVSDFNRADDIIDLSAIDANTTAGATGDQAFLLTNGPSTDAGTMWIVSSANSRRDVYFNTDGGDADFSLIVHTTYEGGTSWPTLNTSDFIL
jgi:Ca2+-binding RTX toxin-like protein